MTNPIIQLSINDEFIMNTELSEWEISDDDGWFNGQICNEFVDQIMNAMDELEEGDFNMRTCSSFKDFTPRCNKQCGIIKTYAKMTDEEWKDVQYLYWEITEQAKVTIQEMYDEEMIMRKECEEDA